MAKEKSKATARAEKHSRQTVIDKRNAAAKHKITKPGRARDHHRRIGGPRVDLPARKVPISNSKLKSYFEFQENEDKQDKRLDTSVTKDKNPPPGFSFVPVGDPELTKRCKDISREREHLIFIVSDTDDDLESLGHHVNRIGYHFRSSDVDDALTLLGGVDGAMGSREFLLKDNDKVPETQAEINKQADDALRDLFPRIPHTDREQIILQSFQKNKIGNARKGAPVVGLAEELPLARRVQLAANAHIRHVHTRYDDLLQETDWFNARRLVEPVCLDIIMKWRGDEETGRDQLDEILREVVIIPDSDDEGEGEDADTMESATSSGDEVQVLREVTRAPSRDPSPPLHAPAHQRHQAVGHRPSGASKKPHLDDPDYEEKMKQQQQQRQQHRQQPRKHKRQWQSKRERLERQRRGKYEEARKRNGPDTQQYTASAGLSHDENRNNMQQEPISQPFYPPHPMARQPLQESRYEQPNNNNYQQPFARQEVGSSISHLINLLPLDSRLPVIYQGTSAQQGPPPFQQPMHRPEFIPQAHQPQHQRNVPSIQGLPILTHEEHLRRQQQRQREQTMAPRARSPTVMPSIENIDLTDSPVRRNSPRMPAGPPRRVQTAPQPQYVDELDHWGPPSPQFRALPQQTEMVFVRDHEGKRRRLIEEPRHRAEPEYVIVQRPRQDAYTFPVSRPTVPVSQPDMRFFDEAYDPRQPILVSSSPITESTPAMAPQPRLVSMRGGGHPRQPSQFDDIFREGDEQHARQLRGESERPGPISNGLAYEQSEPQPAMRRVEPRVPILGIPSTPARISTMQYPLQESRSPEDNHFMQPEGQQRPVERMRVLNVRGEPVELADEQLQRAIRQADSRPPVYARGHPIHQPRQQEYDEWEQPQIIDDGHPGSRLVEARPRHDYRSLIHNRPPAPIRTQSDIEGGQPRYRERTVAPPQHAPPPREIQYQPPRGPVEVIGADGQRYMQLPGGEILPIKTERERREGSMMPQSMSRPGSRMMQQGPPRTGRGFERYEPLQIRAGGPGGFDGTEERRQGQRRWGRGDVIVLDD